MWPVIYHAGDESCGRGFYLRTWAGSYTPACNWRAVSLGWFRFLADKLTR